MVPNEIPPQYLLSASAPESRTLIDILRATVDAYPEVPARRRPRTSSGLRGRVGRGMRGWRRRRGRVIIWWRRVS